MSDDKLRRREPREVYAVARRADALFKAMAADFLLREQFVTNPLQVLAEYMHGESLDPALASQGNALVYAALANRKLVQWLGAYTRAHWQEPPEAEAFAAAFSAAVVDSGADDVVAALIDCALAGTALSTLAARFPLFELLTMVFGGHPPGPITGRVTERVPITRPPVTRRVTEPDVTEAGPAVTARTTFVTGRVTERVPITQPFVTAATYVTEPYSSTDTGPTTRSTDTGPTQQSTSTGPTTRSTDTGPTTRSTDTGPTQQSTDTGPTTRSTDTGPGDRSRDEIVQPDDFGVTHWAVPLHALAMYATELRFKGLLNPNRMPRPTSRGS